MIVSLAICTIIMKYPVVVEVINWKEDRDLVFTRIDDFQNRVSNEKKVRGPRLETICSPFIPLLCNYTTNAADLQDECLPLVITRYAERRDATGQNI